MIETKKPSVELFTFTKDPIKSIALAVSAWSSESITESVDSIDDEIAEVYTKKALKAFHRTALEYVDTVWVIQNVSRAFQQQLTRTRLASFSIQSMRVVTKNGFATNGHYTMPPGLDKDSQMLFHETMLNIEENYNKAIGMGIATEDARGVLPLNIHSDITFRINLNALYHMLSQRLCVNTQWEFRVVALMIKREIEQKIGKILSDPISAPCVKINKCPMRDEYCGVPLWKMDESNKRDVYVNYVRHHMVKGEKRIVWLDRRGVL